MRALRSTLMVFLVFYVVSIQVSMAGMEIFGWGSALFSLILWFMTYRGQSWNEFRERIVIQPGDTALVVLLLAIIGSVLINSPATTNKVFWIGSGRWILLFFFMRIALSFVSFEKTERFVQFLIVLSGLIGLYGVQQHFVGHDYIRGKTIELFGQRADGSPFYRSNGLLSMHTRFGHMSAVWACLPMAYWFCAARTNKFKWVAVVSLLCVLLGLAATLTRADWLSFPVALVVVAFVSWKFRSQKVAASSSTRAPWITQAAVVALLAVAVVGLVTIATPELKQRTETIGAVSTYASNYQRVEIWKATFEIWKDYPILGVGYGVNEELSPIYLKKLGLVRFTGGNAHCTYLQFLAGTGLIGLLAWLVFIATFFVLTLKLFKEIPEERRVLRTLVLAALGAQTVVHVTGLIDCNFHAAEITHAYTFIAAYIGAISLTILPRGQSVKLKN